MLEVLIAYAIVILDYKESWVPKNWCFWAVVLEKTLESPLDCKKTKPANRKGNQSWIFIGRTEAEAERPILWPPDVKSRLIRKDPDAGKDWRQEEKRMTEDEMVGLHHQLDGHNFERAPGVGDGQGSLACCRSQSQTRLSNWTDWCLKSHGTVCIFTYFKSSCLMVWLPISLNLGADRDPALWDADRSWHALNY